MSPDATLTDAQIFHRCRAGDPLAWELFVRRHQQRVFGIAGTYARNPDDVRDLAQEIFIKLYRNLHQCRDAGMLIPWMNALGRNTAIDYFRRMVRHSIAWNDIYDDTVASPGPTPEELCDVANQRELLHLALNSMDTLHREVLMLKEYQELSIEEIAGILDVAVGTVKSRLFNARVKLTRAVLDLCRSEVCDVTL